MKKPEADIRCLPQLFSTLVFEAGSLIEPGVNWTRLAGQQALGTLLSLPVQCWGYRHTHPKLTFSMDA